MKISKDFAMRKIIILSTLAFFAICSQDRSFAAEFDPSDTDGDGVGELGDWCPGTEAEELGNIDVHGCPNVDDDGDGVVNFRDQCSATPRGETVNEASGCMINYYLVSLLVASGPIGVGIVELKVQINYEITAEEAKNNFVNFIKESLTEGQRIENVEVQTVPIESQQGGTCKYYSCDSQSPSAGGKFGGSAGTGFKPGHGGSSPATGSPAPATPEEVLPGEPAVNPVNIAGHHLTGPIDPEILNQELANQGLTTTAANPSAAALLRAFKSQQGISSTPTANLASAQASQIVGLFNQASSVSLRIADESLTQNKNGVGGAYIYAASVLTDAVYEIANTDLVTRLGSNEEVPSIYRNLYQALSGMSYQANLPITEEERARALLAIVNSPVGDMMLAPGSQAQKVSSFGILFKKIQMQITGDETSIDALIEAAKTI